MENHHFQWEIHLQMSIFHCYVSLPECRYLVVSTFDPGPDALTCLKFPNWIAPRNPWSDRVNAVWLVCFGGGRSYQTSGGVSGCLGMVQLKMTLALKHLNTSWILSVFGVNLEKPQKPPNLVSSCLLSQFFSRCSHAYWASFFHIVVMEPGKKPLTPLKTNMFNRKYIFKWWIFHCHVSFGGVHLSVGWWF